MELPKLTGCTTNFKDDNVLIIKILRPKHIYVIENWEPWIVKDRSLIYKFSRTYCIKMPLSDIQHASSGAAEFDVADGCEGVCNEKIAEMRILIDMYEA